MQGSALSSIADRLVHSVLAQDGGTLSDGQLLELFVVRQQQAAFAALLRRHGPMVLRVCRRIARDLHDAEDAFQTTFIVLLRKAASLQSRDLVGPWLHGVALRTALKARTAKARRQTIESQVEMATSAVVDEEWAELRGKLDDAVHRLPEHYRVPVILCELQGRSRKEAALTLQLSEGTLSSRLAKARRLLARRLARPGLTGAMLTMLAVPATLPASLVQSTIQTAAGMTVPALFAPPAVSWLQGVLNMMALHKLTTAVVILLALTGVTVGLIPVGPSGSTPQAFAEDKKEKKEQGPTVRGTIKAADVGKKSITIGIPVVKDKEKSVEEKTYKVADDAKVYLADVLEKKANLPEGTLADLSEGTHVDARLSVDGKMIVAITARGPGVNAGVKSFDKSTGTLTLNTKDKDGAKEMTVKLLKGAKIYLDDGIGKKGDAPKEGKIDHLTEGARVHVQLTVDRKNALGVSIHGGSIHGALKGYDAGTRTLTVTVKEDGQLADKSIELLKDARIDGDLTAGETVVVRLSVLDKEKAVAVRVLKKD